MRRAGLIAAAMLLSGVCSAQAGPCAAEIAQIEAQTNGYKTGAAFGPSAPQTIGAQLGRQPTPATVEKAENQASAIAAATLQRARIADEEGDAPRCERAASELRDLYQGRNDRTEP
jgi:hypothetical protein